MYQTKVQKLLFPVPLSSRQKKYVLLTSALYLCTALLIGCIACDLTIYLADADQDSGFLTAVFILLLGCSFYFEGRNYEKVHAVTITSSCAVAFVGFAFLRLEGNPLGSIPMILGFVMASRCSAVVSTRR